MSALTTILDEMAEMIRDVVDGAEIDIQVEPRMLLNPTTPSIDIYPADPSREEESAAFGDISGGIMVAVRARAATTDHEANQDVLLAFMDDEHDWCIAAALLDDPTLNGHASSIGIQSMTGYVLFPSPDGSNVYIGALWVFLVIPARS